MRRRFRFVHLWLLTCLTLIVYILSSLRSTLSSSACESPLKSSQWASDSHEEGLQQEGDAADRDANPWTEKLAYVTFLSSSPADWRTFWNPFADDKYFTATRILAYQFLHAPKTRTKRGIPFVVMVTSDVSANKRARLQRDGARVVEVREFEIDGQVLRMGSPRWKHDMTKLRIVEMEEYSRLLFLDSDMLITRCMDGIFDEEATQLRTSNTEVSMREESPPSRQYVFSAITHATRNHTFPPTQESGSFFDPVYFNSGFLVLRPDPAMLKYYIPNLSSTRFSWRFPQQNFLNFAHRGDGAVPWQRLPTHWNIVFPTLKDYEAGVASLHDKWWGPFDERLRGKFLEVKTEMEEYYAETDCHVRRSYEYKGIG